MLGGSRPTRTGRRRRTFAAIAAALVGAIIAGSGYLDRGESPSAELARRLQASPEPPRFAIAYAAGGTRVNDCFLPNRRFVVFVDQPRSTVVVNRTPDAATPLAVWTRKRVLLHRTLFADDAVPGSWLAAPTTVAGAARDALRRALGADLAGYLLSDELPASAPATALAALGVGHRVRRLPVAADGADRFAITLDADRFAQATATDTERSTSTTAAADPTTSGVPTPTLEVWLDDNDAVNRIDIRAGGAADGAGGWTTEYTASTMVAPLVGPGDVVDIATIDPSLLRSRRSDGCELPL